MFRYEARDKSAPMDLDQPEVQHRLAQFALPQPEEEGPARKRMHSEITSPSRPFAPQSSQRPLHFGTNTPFIFHLPPGSQAAGPSTPFRSFKPYDPREFTAETLGFRETSQSAGHGWRNVEDVEMRNGDTPQKEAGAAVCGSGSPKVKGAETALGQGEADAARTGHFTNANAEAEGNGEGSSAGVQERKMAGGAVSRTRKKRQKEWRRRERRYSGSEPATDNEGDKALLRRDDWRSAHGRGLSKSEHTYNLHMVPPSLRHSEIPALLLGYLQVFVNAAIVLFVLYLGFSFVVSVRNDVLDRMQEVSLDIMSEIAECSKLYLANRCEPALRVPAMEAPCKAWETCMQRDPTIVGRTNVMAETFAGVINSFVEAISWKTMGFTLVTLSFLIILTNSALWNLRSKVEPVHAPNAYPQHAIAPPPWASHQSPYGQHPHQPWGPIPGAAVGLGSGPANGQGDPTNDDRLAISDGDEKKRKGWFR